MTQEELVRLRHEADAEFKKYPGVVGVGYGFKRTGGKTTDQISFRVYVVEKKEKSELNPGEIIPPDFKGVPTDVIKVPEMTKVHCEDMDFHSPLISGISISNLNPGPEGVYRGTLGCFATAHDLTSPEDVVLVSNRHVLMVNSAKVGDTIFQPRHIEQNGVITVDITPEKKHPVAKIHQEGLEGNHPYLYDGPGEAQEDYFIDCATARVDFCISSWCNTHCGIDFKNEVRGLDVPIDNEVLALTINGVGRVKEADIQQGSPPYPVYKVGRKTSKTAGRVTGVAVAGPTGGRVIEIEATHNNCNGQMQFVDHGDSGSALINKDNQIIGIVFAFDKNNPILSYACHIHPIIDNLKITIITTANPHPATSTSSDAAGVMAEGRINHTLQLRERFLGTEKGREVASLFEAHRHEITHLVNHCRPVTVIWHRNKGPEFLSHIINNARDPQHVVPREIEGVSRQTLIRNIAGALSKHGSSALADMVERHLDEALGYVDRLDNLHELVEQLDPRQAA